MFRGAVQDHFGGFLSHEFEVRGDRSDSIEDDLLQWGFIIGNHPNVFANLHFGDQDLFNQGHKILFHQVNKDFPFLNWFFGNIMYHPVVKGVLPAELRKAFQDLFGVIGTVRENDLECMVFTQRLF